jgi:hypothetical protein
VTPDGPDDPGASGLGARASGPEPDPDQPEARGPKPEAPILTDADVPALATAPASVSAADLVDAVGARVPRKERKKRDRDMDRMADEAMEAELAAADEADRQRKLEEKQRKQEEKQRKREKAEVEDETLDPVERAERKGKRRTMVILAISIAVGVIVTAFVILGRINKDRFFIACEATEIRAEQGRGFPPWGSSPLEGPAWKAIKIPPNAECDAHEVDNLGVLTDEYLAVLVEQAKALLTAKDVTQFDLAAAQLEQALLLARDPQRRDPRKDISRWLGDVEYWRANARLRAAAEEIVKAATQFDAAATQTPQHVGDAAAWAALARRAAALLGAGPNGQTPLVPDAGSGSAGPTRDPPPFGVALPVETPDAAPAPPPEQAPDAGLPTGGVLL